MENLNCTVYFIAPDKNLIYLKNRLSSEDMLKCYQLSDIKSFFQKVRKEDLNIILVEAEKLKNFFYEFKKWLALRSDIDIEIIPTVNSDFNESLPGELGGNVNNFLILPRDKEQAKLLIDLNFRLLESKKRIKELERNISVRTYELTKLNQIGTALSAEKDLDTLVTMILENSRKLTIADSGSIYLVEEDHKIETDVQKRQLHFWLTQNDSKPFEVKDHTMDINEQSIAGYAALTGSIVNLEDTYKIEQDKPFKFNSEYDEKFGYRTKSMLVIPMINRQNEVIGILQLINRKKRYDIALSSPEITLKEVIPFDQQCEELVKSLTSQAATAIENAKLYKEIEQVFEGFVKASVAAIELRDPATFGHSGRVADLSVGLVKAVNKINTGKFANISFSSSEIKELRYTALLHDFGKVGVREEILVKAEKLYPYNTELIKSRFEYIKKYIQEEYSQKKIHYLLEEKREKYKERFSVWDKELEYKLNELDEYLSIILKANVPVELDEEINKKINVITKENYLDFTGKERTYLQEDEFEMLSIGRGSLTERERREIEAHVIHTYKFLEQIPWTKDMLRVPKIAYAHHEKLDGTGYPEGLKDGDIPIQSKIIAIADMYDALTTLDRPYKKAISTDEALDILKLEVENNHLDPELVEIFIDAKIYDLI